MKELFVPKNFRDKSLAIIQIANEIIQEYSDQGFSLTLRQLYYQFVARDMLSNTERSYKNLGSVINDGRLAGMIDWDAIEDRTRNLATWSHYDNPMQAIQSVRDRYDIDMWENQSSRVEVWIEKEALVGIINNICGELDVPYFACRGYVSQSEQWRAGQRFLKKHTHIIHLGDHDPSGIDMTRDNDARLSMFSTYNCSVERIALNMDQINQYNPPPNPTKLTDSRAEGYVREFGYSSWELDALEPSVIVELVRKAVEQYIDPDVLEADKERLKEDRDELDLIVNQLG